MSKKATTIRDLSAASSKTATDSKTRCPWAESSLGERQYHDAEWGAPLYDDQKLFELLCLEGAQAGLSWRTVLDKRPAYRQLYHDFDINKVANMSDAELEQLTQNPGIIRNRLKVFGFRKNALAVQAVIEREGSLAKYLWQFVDGKPQQSYRQTVAEVPAKTPTSDAMSKQLKRDGFTFVGSTICYAFMQASGMVNDHLTECFRYTEVGG